MKTKELIDKFSSGPDGFEIMYGGMEIRRALVAALQEIQREAFGAGMEAQFENERSFRALSEREAFATYLEQTKTRTT